MDCGHRSPALSSGPACPAHTVLGTAAAGGVRLADERSPARQACGGRASPGAGVRPRTRDGVYRAWLARDDPVRRARVSALARTTSGSRGSAGRSSVQTRSRRILGLPARMRFITRPAAISGGWPRAVWPVLAGSAAPAPTVRRTTRRLPHEPSASGSPRPPGGRRTPGPRAGRTPGRRRRARPRRWPCRPDPRWGYRSAAGPTRTRRRPRPR